MAECPGLTTVWGSQGDRQVGRGKVLPVPNDGAGGVESLQGFDGSPVLGTIPHRSIPQFSGDEPPSAAGLGSGRAAPLSPRCRGRVTPRDCTRPSLVGSEPLLLAGCTASSGTFPANLEARGAHIPHFPSPHHRPVPSSSLTGLDERPWQLCLLCAIPTASSWLVRRDGKNPVTPEISPWSWSWGEGAGVESRRSPRILG